MSLSGALSNALSGLTASSRSADIVASNIANGMTEGYGVREIVLAPRSVGDEGGVQVLGINRLVNQVLIADRRSAEAALLNADTLSTFYTRMQTAMGISSDAGSLEDRLSQLEASLTRASGQPESEAMLQDVVNDLKSLATHLNDLGNAVQTERMRADADIEVAVDDLNSTLGQIADLNDDIRKYMVLGHDVSAMLDQRQNLVDRVNEFVPVTELERDRGTIALMTEGGTMLVDGTARELEFTSNAVITADMSLSGGTLSGLSIDGRALDIDGERSAISGGKIDALFKIRDEEAVEIQAQLDGFARDLIERFQDTSVEPTLPATDPGLFTDDGARFDPNDETGLAQRLSVNALVDPSQGGELWQLRDGLTATAAGDVGDASHLNALSDILSTFSTPSSSAFTSGMRTAASLAADLASHIGGALESAISNRTFAQVQYSTLVEQEYAEGVDTDAEMQKLLLIEQSYSANARVVQAVEEMLEWLMSI